MLQSVDRGLDVIKVAQMELSDFMENLGICVDGRRQGVELAPDVFWYAGGLSFNRDVFRKQETFIKPVSHGLRVGEFFNQVLLILVVLSSNAADVQGYVHMHVGGGPH